MAHVTLPPGGAAAGSDYDAAFRVGHACADAKSTTGIRVQLPEGFTLLQAQPRAGWKLASTPREVSWQAEGPQAALPGSERAEFVVRGKLTDKPGALYFKVLQSCDVGSADWAQLPVAGSSEKQALPAARLDVLAPGVAAVDVRDAWVRQTVPGQSGTGAFMKLTAPAGARLVGASTPAAGIAEVHEMKMEGDIMRMRELKDGLALPPRQTVELKPGGLHVMLMELKQPIAKGSTIPLTLRFEDARGAKSALQVDLAVGAPAGAAAAAAPESHGHMHHN
ncbi:copper chaperone PCu(A)C [Variovorax sp. J22P168]|nr:copper chaperone PCu(A)C [Variovorax sp. J22P168]MDM0012156.1 copper chaperone PCu(A)C [Variovorax sp. J22P168]